MIAKAGQGAKLLFDGLFPPAGAADADQVRLAHTHYLADLLSAGPPAAK